MRLSGWSVPLEFVSATSLSKAIQCPEQWRRRYLLKEPDVMYADRFIGIVDHGVHAENFEQKIKTGEDLDLGWMKGKYHAKWDATLEKEGQPEWDGQDPEGLKAKGLLMMEAYHTSVSPKVTPVKVEERFEEKLSGVAVPIVGYADLMTTDRIIERKTAKQKVSKPKPSWRFQGRIYQLVYDLPTEWHVVTKQVTPAIYTAENSDLYLAKGNPDVIVQLVQQVVHRINDLYLRYGPDTTWPTEGLFHDWLCDYCAYKNRGCAAWVLP